jgi:hypothetical protein
MKKILLASIFVALLGCGSLLAQSDGFFSYQDYGSNRTNDYYAIYPSIPASHGGTENVESQVPLGSGLLIFGGLALGYAVLKKD